MSKNKKKQKTKPRREQKVSVIDTYLGKDSPKEDKKSKRSKKTKSGEKKTSNSFVYSLNDPEKAKSRLEGYKRLQKSKIDQLAAREGTPEGEKKERSLLGTLAQKIKSNRSVTPQEIAELGFEFESISYKAASAEKRKAVRFQFEGCAYSRPEKFSEFYLSKKRAAKPLDDVVVEDYDLSQNAFLKEASDFESFKGFEKDLKEVLLKTGVNPSEVGLLTDDDINGCLVDVCEKRGTLKKDAINRDKVFETSTGGKIGVLFEGARETFVKNLANNHGDAVKKIMLSMDRPLEKVERDIELMKEQGLTPKGFNVHHKYPIGGCDGKDYPDVNAQDNFVMILDNPCHKAIHNFMDKTESLGNYHRTSQETEVYPILVKPKDGVVFFAGPSRNKQVTLEQTNDKLRSKKNDEKACNPLLLKDRGSR
jgi:hypothetical protein